MSGTIGLAIIFGTYLVRMITFEMRLLEKTLAIVENSFYKVICVKATKQISWKEYFLTLFLTNLIVVVFVIFVLTFQNYLPLSDGKEGFSFDLAFHTAMSFITNTNLQYYTRDSQLYNLANDRNNFSNVYASSFWNCCRICIYSFFY